VNRLRPTRVEVDLEAIRHNVRALKPDGVELMAVVKANAYGHGAVPVSLAALDAGASWLGVALVEEGLELRAAGIDAPIMVFSEFPPGAERVALGAGLTPVLYSNDGLRRLAEAAGPSGSVGVHVKIDTGMHRVGVWPPEDTAGFVGDVVAAGFELEGLWTHFARSEEDAETTKRQLEAFTTTVEAVRTSGHAARVLHTSNTGATILHPEAHLDLVRPGIGMYGIEPAPGVGSDLGLKPSLSWRTSITAVRRLSAGERTSYGHRYELPRDAWVATAPVGYADGYPRRAFADAQVLVHGERRPVAGVVTMDQLLIDCGELPVAPGDDVVLLGRQAKERIRAEELAGWAGTIGYEVVTRVGSRVPREFVG
jgi:alanine racemase